MHLYLGSNNLWAALPRVRVIMMYFLFITLLGAPQIKWNLRGATLRNARLMGARGANPSGPHYVSAPPRTGARKDEAHSTPSGYSPKELRRDGESSSKFSLNTASISDKTEIHLRQLKRFYRV